MIYIFNTRRKEGMTMGHGEEFDICFNDGYILVLASVTLPIESGRVLKQ